MTGTAPHTVMVVKNGQEISQPNRPPAMVSGQAPSAGCGWLLNR